MNDLPPDENKPPPKSVSGLARIVNATRYSWQGLGATWRYEAAFRQEIYASVVLIPLAALLPATLTQKAMLVGGVVLVLIVELLNSSVEATVDLASPEHHELAKRAKDAGSAAVMVSIGLCALIWALILAELYW